MGGIRKRWEEVRGRELFKINIKVKGPSPISFSIVTTHLPPPTNNQTIPKEESRRKR